MTFKQNGDFYVVKILFCNLVWVQCMFRIDTSFS